MKAPVFDIARSSLHDGDGLRTVVYLKGCTLHCKWCHNPEGLTAGVQILYHAARCIHCGRCAAACPDCYRISAGELSISRENCTLCLRCVEFCPADALRSCGKTMTVEEVFAEVRKDAPYYERTGGGLTLSGGECLLYPDFAYELFTECHNAGINTAVESAFNVPRENIERILPVTDTLIVDIKHIDGEQHRFWTGTGNETILANLRRVADRHPRIWIRIPVIPGATDSGDNIRRIAELANILPGVCRLELLKYNPLAENKYAALGGEYRYETFGEAQSDEWMEDLRSGIKIRPDIMVSVV